MFSVCTIGPPFDSLIFYTHIFSTTLKVYGLLYSDLKKTGLCSVPSMG